VIEGFVFLLVFFRCSDEEICNKKNIIWGVLLFLLPMGGLFCCFFVDENVKIALRLSCNDLFLPFY